MGKEGGRSGKKILNIFLLKYFKLICILLFFISLFAGYAYLLRPKYEDINKEIAAAKEDKEKQIESLEKYLNNLKKYKDSYSQISKDDIKKIDAMIPVEPSFESLFSEMEDLIKARGLALSSLDLNFDSAGKAGTAKNKEASASQAGAGKVVIKMSVDGVSYKLLKQLLYDLENNLRIMDVLRVDFSPESGSVGLEIATYYLK